VASAIFQLALLIGAVTMPSIMPALAAAMASVQNLIEASPATRLGSFSQGGTLYSS